MKRINDARNTPTRINPSMPPALAPVTAASAPMISATTMIAPHMMSRPRKLSACARR
jgi:hypothetical protein